MGFPMDFFPVLFAVPRVVGWLAHWRQLMLTGNVKIWRPRQIYLGEGERPYVPIEERSDKPVAHPSQEPSKVSRALRTCATPVLTLLLPPIPFCPWRTFAFQVYHHFSKRVFLARESKI